MNPATRMFVDDETFDEWLPDSVETKMRHVRTPSAWPGNPPVGTPLPLPNGESLKSRARHLLDDMPDAPKKVPAGHVRLWHFTKDDDTSESIAAHGILVDKNTYGGVGGEPTGVWLSTKRPEDSNKPVVEVVMPISELSSAADNPKYLDPDEYGNSAEYGHYVAQGDVPAENIVNIHRKWQWWVQRAMENQNTIDNVLSGKFDDQLDKPNLDYDQLALKRAIAWIKENHGKSDKPKSLFDILVSEDKMRHVRDPAYWGEPVGTPIVPGVKPVGRTARGKTPTTPNKPRTGRTGRSSGGTPYGLERRDLTKPHTLWVGEMETVERVAHIDRLPAGTTIYSRDPKTGATKKVVKLKEGGWEATYLYPDQPPQVAPNPTHSSVVNEQLLAQQVGNSSNSPYLRSIQLPGEAEVPLNPGMENPPNGISAEDWRDFYTSYEAREFVTLGDAYVTPQNHDRPGLLAYLNTELIKPRSLVRMDDVATPDSSSQQLIFTRDDDGKWHRIGEHDGLFELPPLSDKQLLDVMEYAADLNTLENLESNSSLNLTKAVRFAKPGYQYVNYMMKGHTGRRDTELWTVRGFNHLPTGARVVANDSEEFDEFTRQPDGNWTNIDTDYKYSTSDVLQRVEEVRGNFGSIEMHYKTRNGSVAQVNDYEYDAEGYDVDGYDADGYNRNQLDVDGYDREGYDEEGYDANGVDVYGNRQQGIASIDTYDLPKPSDVEWGERNAEIYEASQRDSLKSIIEMANSNEDWREAIKGVYAFKSSSGEYIEMNSVEEPDYTDEPMNLKLNGTVYSADGNHIGTVTRTIRFDGHSLIAENEYLMIASSAQGTGFASEFNRHMENWYIANGFFSVKVHADIDVGGYAWARDGFDWDSYTDAANMRRILNRIDNEDDGEATDEIDHWRSVIDDVTSGKRDFDELPTPFELSNIGWEPGAYSWPGKDGMLGSDWQGRKILNPDARAVQRADEMRAKGLAKSKVKKKKDEPRKPVRQFPAIEPDRMSNDEAYLVSRMEEAGLDHQLISSATEQPGDIRHYIVRNAAGETYEIVNDPSLATVEARQRTNYPARETGAVSNEYLDLESVVRYIERQAETRNQEIDEIQDLLQPVPTQAALPIPVPDRDAPLDVRNGDGPGRSTFEYVDFVRQGTVTATPLVKQQHTIEDTENGRWHHFTYAMLEQSGQQYKFRVFQDNNAGLVKPTVVSTPNSMESLQFPNTTAMWEWINNDLLQRQVIEERKWEDGEIDRAEEIQHRLGLGLQLTTRTSNHYQNGTVAQYATYRVPDTDTTYKVAWVTPADEETYVAILDNEHGAIRARFEMSVEAFRWIKAEMDGTSHE